MKPSLRETLAAAPYEGYAYSYPHKTAYRPLSPPRALAKVWEAEPRHNLYLYLHVPFCEMRCGFCNLFTTANPRDSAVDSYLDALERQADRTKLALGPASFARGAIGGGTPTYLEPGQLARLLATAAGLGFDATTTPMSVEVSPRTATPEKLALLADFGVERVSIGVQSWVEAEVHASGRAQHNEWVEAALEAIRAARVPTLNVDLIYGLLGQTVRSWLASLEAALEWRPEEFYLYPLYIRPLTGLGRRGAEAHNTLRLECYRQGRDLLLAEGYEQVSMRMYQLTGSSGRLGRPDRALGREYTCQSDGMLGLGCGARSYTRTLHYSNDWAVGAAGVRAILADYTKTTAAGFEQVTYGCDLTPEEQRRRWVIKSLLRTEGLDLDRYFTAFSTEAGDDLPVLSQLEAAELVELRGRTLAPTAAGLELSDAIGPWLYSPTSKATMSQFALH